MTLISNPTKCFSVTYYYDSPNRSTLNLPGGKKLLSSVFLSCRGGSTNQPVMFLRSPKHFKTGKQLIYKFNKKVLYKKYFFLTNPNLLLAANYRLFNFFKFYAPKFYTSELFLSKIKIKSCAKIIF